MGKYVYVYYAGKDTDAGDDEAWGNWFSELGDKLIDGGNPFNEGGQAVHDGGVMPVKDMPVTGYSIVSADSMQEATDLAKGCPLVTLKSGAVCVYEAMPM
jgi:YCII-related domain